MRRIAKLMYEYADKRGERYSVGWERSTMDFAAGYRQALEDAAERFELGFERNDVVQDILDDVRALADQEEA